MSPAGISEASQPAANTIATLSPDSRVVGFPKFEKLVLEIRLMIWKLMLPEAQIIEIVGGPELGMGGATKNSRPPMSSIAHVNQESRNVFLENYFYLPGNAYFNPAIDTLYFSDVMGDENFIYRDKMIKQLGSEKMLQAIRYVAFNAEWEDNGLEKDKSQKCIRNSLELLPGVEMVTIVVGDYHHIIEEELPHPPEYGTLEFNTDGFDDPSDETPREYCCSGTIFFREVCEEEQLNLKYQLRSLRRGGLLMYNCEWNCARWENLLACEDVALLEYQGTMLRAWESYVVTVLAYLIHASTR